jgi:hypothetical protein
MAVFVRTTGATYEAAQSVVNEANEAFCSSGHCQPPLGMTTECRVCAVELADPVWFGRVVLTVFVGAVTVTIFGSG